MEQQLTIFGFNTDIRHGDTVYHVQTEPRQNELTIQTAIFVRGRCVEKRNVSYADETAAPDFSEDRVHQLLVSQHKLVVNCIREGQIESLLHTGTLGAALSGDRNSRAAQVPTDADETDALDSADPSTAPAEPQLPSLIPQSPELKLEWLSSQSVYYPDSVLMRYRLTEGSTAIEGATLIARLEASGAPSAYCRTTTNPEGEADVSFVLAQAATATDQLRITVQASHAGQSIARGFLLCRR